MLTAIKTPRWTGSTPRFVAMGNRMGAMMSRMEVASMTLPATSRTMLMTMSKTQTSKCLATIQAAIAWGMFSLVIRNENRIALVMM